MEQEIREFGSLTEFLDKQSTPTSIANSYRRFLEIKAREKGIPLHGFFELTPLCNLDCKMCYVHLSPTQLKGRKLLDVDQWKMLIKQAVDEGLMYATLTGGECMLYPGFDEIYLYLQSLGVHADLITNGVLLNKERVAFFKQHPPAGIQVSFYGVSEDGYERVTGHRVFSIVKANTIYAKEAGLPIKAGITSSNYMGAEDEALMELLTELHIPFTVNSTLFSARLETGRNLEDYDQSNADYIRLRKAYIKHKNSAVPKPCANECIQHYPARGIQCGAGNSGFGIDWQGRLFACMMLPDISANPLEGGFAAAWKHIHAEAKEYPNPQECNDCQFQSICTRCVAAHRNHAIPGHANPQICALANMLVEAEAKQGE